MKRIIVMIAALAAMPAAGCGGGGAGAGAGYTVGGTVSGLAGSGLVLRNNGADDLSVATAGTFTFTAALANGSGYAVSVAAQPSNPSQTCTASNNSGIIADADVTTVSVVCSTNAYHVGGTVSGLTGAGLVLQNNAGDDLAVSADGSFTFPVPVADGAGYTVTVKTQPANPSQTCTANANTGTIAGADVTNVGVVCSTNAYAVGGTVSGLLGSGLVLQNNGADDLSVPFSQGTFTFASAVTDGAAYAVTVKAQPSAPAQTCVVTGGAGTVAGADVLNVGIDCVVDDYYTVGGTVSGLASGETIVLRNNSGDDLTLTSDGTFTFSAPLPDLSTYRVTVRIQPADQLCSIANGVGRVYGANVTNIEVYCADALDPAFNGNGIVVSNGAAGGSGNDSGASIAMDGNGKILAAGNSVNAAGNADMVIWRYNADGTPDTTFNGAGYVVHNGAAGGDGSDYGYALTLDSNGKILVAGNSVNAAGNLDMVVWRYNADGTPDTTFNGTGYTIHNGAAGGDSHDYGISLAVDGNGKILVSGISWNAEGNYDMAVWRYNADGTLDTTFNGTGYAIHNGAAGGNGADYGNSLAVDGNGRIVVAGHSRNAAGNDDMVIWRYNVDGALDSEFNGTGLVVYNGGTGRADFGNSLRIDGSGKILVAGYSNAAGTFDMVIWRYNADGTADTTFNSTGMAIHNGAAGANGADYGNSIALDASGNILVCGRSLNVYNDIDIAVWRYTADGSLDTSFNSVGFLTHNGAAGGSGADYGNSITTDANGKVVVAGKSPNAAGDFDMVVWRFNP